MNTDTAQKIADPDKEEPVYLVDDEEGNELSTAITWSELAAVNDPDTMDAIREELPNVGDETVLGMCCRVKRIR